MELPPVSKLGPAPKKEIMRDEIFPLGFYLSWAGLLGVILAMICPLIFK